MLLGNFLAVDTSTTSCSIFIQVNGKTITRELHQQATHATAFFGWFNDILAEEPNLFEELNCLGLCIGPGRFNGVRVGMTFISTLMVQYGLPVWTCTSHQLLQQQANSLDGVKKLAIFAKYGHAYVVSKGDWHNVELLPFDQIPQESITFDIESVKAKENHTRLSIAHLPALIDKQEAKIFHKVNEIELIYGAHLVNS